MTYTSQVNNGNATVNINTNNMESGKYKIKVNYPQNDYYNASSNNNGVLTLTTRVCGDCTDPTQWSIYSDQRSYVGQGDCRSDGVHSGTYRFLVWNNKIPLDSKLTVHGTISNSHRYNLLFMFTNLLRDISIDVGKDVGSLNLNREGTTIGQFSQYDSGEFTLNITTHSDTTQSLSIQLNNETITVPYTSSLSDGYYYSFRKWANGEIIIDDIYYEIL